MEDSTRVAAVETPAVKKKTIVVSEVISLLHSGYTRKTRNKDYNPQIGCIQDYYSLSDDEVKLLFTHPKLKKVRTKMPPVNIDDVFDIVDDEEPAEVADGTTGEFSNEVVE